MAVGTSVGDAYIIVHADTKRFRADLARLVTTMAGYDQASRKMASRNNVTRRSFHELNRVMLAAGPRHRIVGTQVGFLRRAFVRLGFATRGLRRDLSRLSVALGFARKAALLAILPFTLLARSLSNTFRRMDRTVLLVLKLIAVAAPQIAALGSALSSTLVAIAASAFYALSGLAPLLGILVPFAAGIAAAVVGFKDIDKLAPGVRDAAKALSEGFKDVAVPAFFKEWSSSAESFLRVLDAFINDPEMFASIGKAFASVTDAFTGLLDSEAGQNFKSAITGPLSEALGAFGEGFVTVLGVIMDFLTRAAPYAVLLADQFKSWAESLRETFDQAAMGGGFITFMDNAMDSLSVVLGLFGAVKDVLGTLFAAGVTPGNQFLAIITKLLNQFNKWMNTIAGQTALEEWFKNGEIIMAAVFRLLGAVGTAIADLVTPEVVEQFVGLLDAVGVFADLLSDVLATIARAGIIDLIIHLLTAVGTAIRPLLPTLGDLLSVIATLITNGLDILAPALAVIFELLGDYLQPALDFIIPALDAMREAVEPLIPVIADIIQRLADWGTVFGEKLQPKVEELTEIFIEKMIPALVHLYEEVLPIIDKLTELALEFLEDTNASEHLLDMLILLFEAMAFHLEMLSKFIAKLKEIWKWMGDTRKEAEKLAKALLGLPGDVLNKGGNVLSDIGGFLGNLFASGTIVNQPTAGVFGEEGREALVPLDRPLHQVDPSVRWLSALAQGKATMGGSSLSIEPGAILVQSPSSNERLVAQAVLDEIAKRSP